MNKNHMNISINREKTFDKIQHHLRLKKKKTTLQEMGMEGTCVCVYSQSCLTLCYPMDCSPPGSSAHGILQARVLSGLPCLPPGDLPDSGNQTWVSCIAGRFFTAEPLRKPRVSWVSLKLRNPKVIGSIEKWLRNLYF